MNNGSKDAQQGLINGSQPWTDQAAQSMHLASADGQEGCGVTLDDKLDLVITGTGGVHSGVQGSAGPIEMKQFGTGIHVTEFKVESQGDLVHDTEIVRDKSVDLVHIGNDVNHLVNSSIISYNNHVTGKVGRIIGR